MRSADDVVARFRAARRDPSLVVLEGLHAVKHALRFDADVIEAWSPNPSTLHQLTAALAPDVAAAILTRTAACAAAVFERLTPGPVSSGIVALARRPQRPWPAAGGSVIVLDRPRHLGNVGAAIRVAAAAGARGVLVLGDVDPFHPTVVRGAAGLQFAITCRQASTLPTGRGPLVAFGAGGTPLADAAYPADAWLAFGSERAGLSEEVDAAACRRVTIPMRAGVSSLNLATAVAVALYAGPAVAPVKPLTSGIDASH